MRLRILILVLVAGSTLLPGQTSILSQTRQNAGKILRGSAGGHRLSPQSQVGTCPDERQKIISEYVKYKVRFVPTCDAFTRDIHSEHFAFGTLNTGDYSWAIIKASLLQGLEHIHLIIGNEHCVINSGYRNPARNSRLSSSGSSPNSRHMYGDAADLKSDATTWDLMAEAGKTISACVEPRDQSGFGHVHVDWRGKCPAGW